MSTKVSYVYCRGIDFHVYWDYRTDSYMFDFDGHRMRVSDDWVIRLWQAVAGGELLVVNKKPTKDHLAEEEEECV